MLWWRHYVRLSGTQCVFCLRTVSWKKITREHLKPRSLGGKDVPKNIVPSCRDCNSRKGNGTIAEFFANPRRIKPAADAPAHPLGFFDEEGNFHFSAAAKQVQAEDRERRRIGSRLKHQRPYFLVPNELQAAIENMALPPHRDPASLPVDCLP